MKLKQFLIAVCIGTMFAACSSKDDCLQEIAKDPIVISANICGMQTRSTGDATALQNTDFLNGEQINVYMKKNSQGVNIDGIPGKGYVTYTKGDSGWTTSDVTSLFWPADDGVEFTGIYPSTVDLNSGLFTVQLGQGPDEDYRKSDLMYVVTSRMSHDQVDLQFKHLLSKITIKVDPNGLMTQQELIGSLYGVELLNVYKQVSIASDFSVTASGEKTQWIDALWDDGVYNPSNGVSCIIPPQTVEAGAQFIAVNINDENVFRYTVPSGGHAFKGGKEYVFNIKLVQSGIELANMTVKNWDTETFNVDAK